MIFRQLFDRDSSTYSYLLADRETREAVLIDPVAEQVDRDVRLLSELDLTLVHTLETHVHADHVTAAGLLRERLGARTVASARAAVPCVDIAVDTGDAVRFGRHTLEVLATPGHTAGCVTYVLRDGPRPVAFTGDALLVRGCGRTDFQGGDAATLYRSVRDTLFSLPPTTLLYPAHDYRGQTVTTVAEERRHNPRLCDGMDEAAFIAIMDALDLPDPRMMDVAVPANQSCGASS